MSNNSHKKRFIQSLLNRNPPSELHALKGHTAALFSAIELLKYLEKEERHDQKILTQHTHQPLKSMSSGEQKKALLHYLLQSQPDFLILDNPFDNLDDDSQLGLKKMLYQISKKTSIVQLISRQKDLLPFVDDCYRLHGNEIHKYSNTSVQHKQKTLRQPIPSAMEEFTYAETHLITLKQVSVTYGDKTILRQIDWEIKTGEFWKLIGENGSGKTTLLSMITGENSKGYGQDLFLFGKKKGSGESIWDIKKKIGYVTPAMTDRFLGYHTAQNMLLSGLFDSVGLYKKPSKRQELLAKEWLELIDMAALKDSYFHELSMGQQRMLMTARAMIKHPLLLILDEPTVGLDDESAQLFVNLVNQLAQESNTTIIFVSHRTEPGLQPTHVYELQMTPEGSVGRINLS